MKGTNGKYPYEKYIVYKEFHKDEGRWYAILIPKDKTDRYIRNMSYARYLMAISIGRELDIMEHVDHIDNNKLNDQIDNLQILTQKENREKQKLITLKRMVRFKCPNCGKIFIKLRNESHLARTHQRFTACSKKCAGKFGMLMYNHPDDPKVQYGIEHNIIEEYDAIKPFVFLGL